MRQRKPKPTLDGITFDSKEEVEFYMWCKEGEKSGLILGFTYHPEAFRLSPSVFEKETIQLKTKTKEVERVLFRAHEYQPDFYIITSQDFLNLKHGMKRASSYIIGGETSFYIDIKPSFDMHDSRKALFAINQKWVYSKWGVYINKVVPKELFAKTFAPAIFHKRTGKPLTKYASCKSVQDITKEI